MCIKLKEEKEVNQSLLEGSFEDMAEHACNVSGVIIPGDLPSKLTLGYGK
jgi:hypothetical protein